MSIELIAFDIGGVLAIKNSLNLDSSKLLFDQDFLDLQCGKVRAEHYLAKKNINKSLFESMISTHENISLLKILKQPYIFASNINKLHYEKFISYAEPNSFALKNSALSYELGYLKPDNKFFELLLNKNKLAAKNILFVDDKIENIKAAYKASLSVLHCAQPKFLADLIKTYL